MRNQGYVHAWCCTGHHMHSTSHAVLPGCREAWGASRLCTHTHAAFVTASPWLHTQAQHPLQPQALPSVLTCTMQLAIAAGILCMSSPFQAAAVVQGVLRRGQPQARRQAAGHARLQLA